MNMIRHDHVGTDPPTVKALACLEHFPDDFVRVVTGEDWTPGGDVRGDEKDRVVDPDPAEPAQRWLM